MISSTKHTRLLLNEFPDGVNIVVDGVELLSIYTTYCVNVDIIMKVRKYESKFIGRKK